MQEKYFWLVISVLIVLFSGICMLIVGYVYFIVLPRPMITSSAPVNRTTASLIVPTAQSTIAQSTNPPLSLVIVTPTVMATALPPTATKDSLRETPEEFIRSYYTLINQRSYETTFSMLSDDFKDQRHCCNPDGSYQIEPYKDWWDSVDEVVVLSVDTLDWEEDSAVVVINLQYRMQDGRVVNDSHTFNLVVDLDDGDWLIY